MAHKNNVKILLTHPTSTTHSELSDVDTYGVGILPGLIWVSEGWEHIDDYQIFWTIVQKLQINYFWILILNNT